MSDLERIVVLAGGLSPEREVSLRSGDRVCDARVEAGIHAIVADADSALLSLLRADPPSAVFPAIHGVCGEDGAIAESVAVSTRSPPSSSGPNGMVLPVSPCRKCG